VVNMPVHHCRQLTCNVNPAKPAARTLLGCTCGRVDFEGGAALAPRGGRRAAAADPLECTDLKQCAFQVPCSRRFIVVSTTASQSMSAPSVSELLPLCQGAWIQALAAAYRTVPQAAASTPAQQRRL